MTPIAGYSPPPTWASPAGQELALHLEAIQLRRNQRALAVSPGPAPRQPASPASPAPTRRLEHLETKLRESEAEQLRLARAELALSQRELVLARSSLVSQSELQKALERAEGEVRRLSERRECGSSVEQSVAGRILSSNKRVAALEGEVERLEQQLARERQAASRKDEAVTDLEGEIKLLQSKVVALTAERQTAAQRERALEDQLKRQEAQMSQDSEEGKERVTALENQLQQAHILLAEQAEEHQAAAELWARRSLSQAVAECRPQKPGGVSVASESRSELCNGGAGSDQALERRFRVLEEELDQLRSAGCGQSGELSVDGSDRAVVAELQQQLAQSRARETELASSVAQLQQAGAARMAEAHERDGRVRRLEAQLAHQSSLISQQLDCFGKAEPVAGNSAAAELRARGVAAIRAKTPPKRDGVAEMLRKTGAAALKRIEMSRHRAQKEAHNPRLFTVDTL